MLHLNIKSLLGAACIFTLTALAITTAPLATAGPSSGAELALNPIVAPAVADDSDSDDSTKREETYHLICDDTEQPEHGPDQIIGVVEVTMGGITWFEAETAVGDRYLISDIETNVLGGGHGPVQIGGGVYYVCWD